MKIILLPGNSKSNIKWLHDWRSFLKKNNFDSELIEYKHWKSDAQPIDFDLELSKIRSITEAIDEPYTVLAKSIGSVLATKAVHDHIINPDMLIFLGFPSNLNGYKENGFDLKIKTWIKEGSKKHTCFKTLMTLLQVRRT